MKTKKTLQSINPFEIIDARLSNIENLLTDISHKLNSIPCSTKEPKHPNYITRKDACKILKIGMTKFQELTKRGEIPVYRIDSNIRLIESEVYEYLSVKSS